MKVNGKVIKQWYHRLPLSTKLIVLVCLAGMLPIGVGLMVSMREIQKQSRDQQLYALNQGFEQTSQALEDKMSRLHNISTMLAVNDMVNLSLKLTGEEKALAQQLVDFESIDSYAYGMEMAFETSNIWFYIDDALPVVNDSRGRYRSLNTVRQTQWYQELMNSNGTPTWVSFSEDTYDTSRTYVAITRKLWNQEDYSQDIGVLAVSLERDILEDMMIGAVEGQAVYIETGEGNLLAANMAEAVLPRIPLGIRNEQGDTFREILLDGRRCMVRSQLLESTNVYLVSVVARESLTQTTNVANVGIITWYLCVCMVVLGVFIPLTRSVTKRLKLLKTQMMLTQDGVLQKIETAEDYPDEIGQLIRRYNGMTEQVAELLQEQYVLGQEKIRLELKALQSQINPHFLYNTLDMINWMAQKNETDNIRSVVQSMSGFYRLTLSRGQDIVPIGDEVRMCEAYMEIQKRRYRGRILYEADVDREILDCLIPKITLQPFLENAIVHGIHEKDDARGVVILNGWMEDGRITLSVTDDGRGISMDDRKKSTAGSHYGMKNIEKRLSLYYGEEIPIQIESSPGVGTCVIISVPVRRVG